MRTFALTGRRDTAVLFGCEDVRRTPCSLDSQRPATSMERLLNNSGGVFIFRAALAESDGTLSASTMNRLPAVTYDTGRT